MVFQEERSLNGILEMEEFRDTFQSYITTVDKESNSSSSGVCSSGNGASSDSIIGLIVSIAGAGAVVGSLVAGWFSDRFSRKYSLSLGGVTALIGALLMILAFHIWMLLLGRLLIGIGMGFFYMVMPVYISELSPKEHRGALTSIIGPSYNGGILAALCLNVGFSKFPLGWRMASITVAVSALTYAIGMLFVPHTPRWLAKKGRDKEALAVLGRINRHIGKETVIDTFLELKELQADTAAGSKRSYALALRELFNWKYRLLFCAGMLFINSIVGPFIQYYTSTFFCELNILPFYGALAVSTVVLISSIIMILFIDRLGRKALFLGSIPVLFSSGLVIAILLQLDIQSDASKYAVVILICLYAFAIASSWVTLPWVIISEIFPNHIRSATVAIASATYWFWITINTQFIPLTIGSIQLHGFFYILTGVNLFSFFYILFLMPETMGISLEETNILFSQTIWQRFVGYVRCRGMRGPQGEQSKVVEQLDSQIFDGEISLHYSHNQSK